MKQLFITALAAAAILTSCNQATQTQPQATTVESVAETTTPSTSSSEFAYINVDQVLSQSDFYTSEGVALQAKTQKTQEGWARREQAFQHEATQLQEKYQKGLITTANAQKEQESIEQRMRNYQTSAQSEARQLEEENIVFTNRAQDLITRAVKSVNSNGQYRMVFNANTLIDADSTLDISTMVLEAINQLYATEK